MSLTGLELPPVRWRLRDPEAHLNGIPRFPRITATVLAARGITTRADADVFYKPHLAAQHDAMLLPGMEDAIARTRRAIAEGELIALFGDFDVDGVPSVAVLYLGMGPLGANMVTYIPERFSEGYGLNFGAIDRLAEQKATLLITADCGISSVEEVAYANSKGMDVLILKTVWAPQTVLAGSGPLPPSLCETGPGR
jgi:single-stranded-DNA-specific exonuclease